MSISNRTFALLAAGTLLVLVYVHEQVSILQISYTIEKKEREVARLGEDYKLAKYQVARLRSPQFLRQELKARSLGLAAPKAVQVVKIVKPKELLPPLNQPATVRTNIASWFGGFMKEAQAKTSK